MANLTAWRDLHRAARQAQRRFNLPAFTLEPLTDSRARLYGDCRHADNRIRLRVHRLGNPSRPLSRRTLVDTLAHELAHLVHEDHPRTWRALYHEIKAFLG